MCKKRAIKTGKAKDVTGNDKKVILCNVLETTRNDNDCFLKILIGPKVADTTFESGSKILTDNEVKYFAAINFSEHFKSTREKLYSKLSQEQDLRKIAKSLYIEKCAK